VTKKEHSVFRWRPALQYKSLYSARGAQDPIQLFEKLFIEARKALPMPEAMTLATADKKGTPSARVVLLKGIDQGGFCFFTNYLSKKAKDLAQNPRAALMFFWEPLEIQIRIDGKVRKTNAKYSDDYWKSRPRASQIGALASPQSTEITSFEKLAEAAQTIETAFEGLEIPRPKRWGGYTVTPTRIEFWFGKPNRLHERVAFEKSKSRWKSRILGP